MTVFLSSECPLVLKGIWLWSQDHARSPMLELKLKTLASGCLMFVLKRPFESLRRVVYNQHKPPKPIQILETTIFVAAPCTDHYV